jgi:hypothetical protein
MGSPKVREGYGDGVPVVGFQQQADNLADEFIGPRQ